MNKTTIQEALNSAIQRIDRLDAQLLLSHILKKPKSHLITWPEQIISEPDLLTFNQLIAKRATGYPLAYLVGHKSFWDMDLIVTPDVLIPRPDTEILVETALSKIRSGDHVLELATGSGAIACALAREHVDIEITATDISSKTLAIAHLNASKYDLNNIRLIESHWFSGLDPDLYDLIIANPPYLGENDPHLSNEIRFEPRSALVSGPVGDEDYILIISQARNYLKSGGWLLLEHGCEQGDKVRALLQEQGFSDIFTVKDLAGLERVSGGYNAA
jgi:release factor glutamine methyltransferase